MTSDLVRTAAGTLQTTGSLPADVWRVNRGIYLGCTTTERTNQRRPLQGQEDTSTASAWARYRSSWEPDGKFHLYQGEGHIAVFGAPGSGKSRKLLMVNLLKLRDWSCVVIDTKAELVAHTALWRSRQPGHKVYVLDPFGMVKENYPKLYAQHPELFESHGFNPIAALNPQSSRFVDDAKVLAEALITTEGTREIHFPQGAQALVKGLMMAMRVSKPGTSDNLRVLRYVLGLGGTDLAKYIDRQVRLFGADYPAISASLNEFRTYLAEDREVSGIRRTATIQTDWLDSPDIQRDLTRGNPIDFASFKHRPQTCYLVLPPEFLESHKVWLRLMVAGALRPLMRSVERAPVPVLFMLDEFAQLGQMDIVLKNLALLRGFGVKLMTIWQDIGQMKPIYGDAWENFMSTADIKVVFSMSNHVDSREYFSRLSSERFYRHHTTSSSTSNTSGWSNSTNSSSHWSGASPFNGGGGNGTGFSQSSTTSHNTSVNEVIQNERVIKPYELAALDSDEAVVFSRRGRMDRSILPQPEVIPGAADAIGAARAVIDGRNQMARLPPT